jgi:hypothetical protein
MRFSQPRGSHADWRLLPAASAAGHGLYIVFQVGPLRAVPSGSHRNFTGASHQVFGQSRHVGFGSYGSRRSGWHLPRWLQWLLGGIAVGAAAVIGIQERYLPPRLSASASEELRRSLDDLDVERLHLKQELGELSRRLEMALAEKKVLASELGTSRTTIDRLRDELTLVVSSLPPDPRGGFIEVRAGRFTAKDGMLSYDVVLTQDQPNDKPLPGIMQLLVAGESERGTQSTVTAKPIALSIGRHEVVRGSLQLPEGFRPRQTTVQVLDRVAGKSLGMRVLLVD